ncbi:hypothetical protein BN129_4350 [Cronobacter sakazakii 701]|nr:hypothetical protein BN129_4350 [Cronobacter sakazakii 701]
MNGSISLSSAWRYSELASKTPARNAPIAIDSPASSSSSPKPNTRNSATALNTSRSPERATKRSAGRATKRPSNTTSASAPTTFSAERRNALAVVASPLAASSGIIATSGIAAISWNSSTAKALRPICDAVRLRSFIACMAMAVEESASVRPISSATCQRSPSATQKPPSSRPHAPICNAPPPKTEARSFHRRCGSSSSPMTNSISTTPISAKCKIACASVTSRNPHGPINPPAIRYPSTEPSPRRTATGTISAADPR